MTGSAATTLPAEPGPATRRGAFERLRRWIPALSVAIFLATGWILLHEFHRVHWRDVIGAFRAVPPWRVVASVGLTAVCYALLSAYDVLAFRFLGQTLPIRRILPAAFVGFAFTNSAGNSLVTGTPLRYRLYGSLGVETATITRVVLLGYLTFWIGVVFVGGFVFTAFAPPVPAFFHGAFRTARPLGGVLLALALGYLVFVARGGREVHIRGFTLPRPGLRMTLGQIALSSTEWVLSSAALWVLLPAGSVGFPLFVGVCLLAVVLGLVSQVPAGLGVVETVVGLSLGGAVPLATLLGALLLYRVVYYMVPLAVAAVALAAHEAGEGRVHVERVGRIVGSWTSQATPMVFGLLTLVAGGMLLFAGVIPHDRLRLRWVGDVFPLPVIEISHFVGSIVGVGLLVLSRGIQRRSSAAYGATLFALALGILVSIFRGLEWESAVVFTLLLLMLLPARREFYRKAALSEIRWTPGWTALLGIAVLSVAILLLFAYRQVEYRNELWWQFALAAEAPRSMRAAITAAVAALAFGGLRLLRGGSPPLAPPLPGDVERAGEIARAGGDIAGLLVYLGDKRILFNEDRSAFLQYGVSGRVWMSMGDPCGSASHRAELAWQFRELVDRYDGIPAFYQVSERNLALYLDLGLALHNIGEMARVPVASFSLEGPERRDLRQVLRRFENREQCTFAVLPPEEVPPLLPRLRGISDEWLRSKKGREKKFSLGCFQESYLRRFPVALVRRGDEILAFANLWTAGDRSEYSFDLMRHVESAPNGTMEYLFSRLMVWGHEQGFGVFNLGMAPLSGLENREFAPLWNRIGALVFRHGAAFYNFQGLRQFKNKFDPEWTPRYVACPGGLALSQVLGASVALISGPAAERVPGEGPA